MLVITIEAIDPSKPPTQPGARLGAGGTCLGQGGSVGGGCGETTLAVTCPGDGHGKVVEKQGNMGEVLRKMMNNGFFSADLPLKFWNMEDFHGNQWWIRVSFTV